MIPAYFYRQRINITMRLKTFTLFALLAMLFMLSSVPTAKASGTCATCWDHTDGDVACYGVCTYEFPWLSLCYCYGGTSCYLWSGSGC